MKSIQTILFLIIFSTFSFSQAQYQWVRKLVGNSLGNPIDYELNNTDNVYYGTENKIYKSTDRGETFNQLGNDIPSATEVKNIILYDTDPATMLVAVESNINSAKIFKTTDAGENLF